MLLNRNKISKKKVLIIGPYPPPYGGVATFVENTMKILGADPEYEPLLYRIGKKDQVVSNELQLLIDLFLQMKYGLYILIHKPNIIHIHSASYLSFFRSIPYLIISKYLSRALVLFHIHGAEFKLFYNGSNKFVKTIIAGVLRVPNKIIVTSDSWVSYFYEIGIKNKIYSLNNGYDSTIFYKIDQKQARDALKINVPDKNILLNIGNLLNYKGQKYLFEAISILKNEKIDCHLFIIGTGPLENDLKNQCTQLNLTDSITFVGKVDSLEEMALFINAADFFILPSLNEGNPIVMFESMACGKPFIGTRVGGIPDIIVNSDLGILCEPGNPLELTESIKSAYNKKWDSVYISNYAEKYSWIMVFKSLNELYKDNK